MIDQDCQENACWRERVKHENAKACLNEQFDFNPKHCKFIHHENETDLTSRLLVVAITEKPTTVKQVSKQDALTTEEELKVLKAKLDSLAQKPKQKFAYPVTSAQELGWDMDTEFEVNRPKYKYNKALCAETSYANSYVTMSGVSPYAAKRPAGGQEQRK